MRPVEISLLDHPVPLEFRADVVRMVVVWGRLGALRSVKCTDVEEDLAKTILAPVSTIPTAST